MSDDDEFKRDVRYFYQEKGDPTRFSGWDAARCQRLLPAFYEAWSKEVIYGQLAMLAIKEIERD